MQYVGWRRLYAIGTARLQGGANKQPHIEQIVVDTHVSTPYVSNPLAGSGLENGVTYELRFSQTTA